jgi:hypothetical protein
LTALLLALSLVGGPGCIAAMTSVPAGPIASGETVTFTDGSIISPVTRFISRTWEFGDGATLKSATSGDSSVTHSYANRTGKTQLLTARLIVRTRLGDCSTSVQIVVESSAPS